MTKTYSIAEAKDHLPRVVHEVEEGITIELTRRGKPVAVVLGMEEFERLSRPAKPIRFWEAYQEFRREIERAPVELDPDEVFAGTRDRSAGRGFGW